VSVFLENKTRFGKFEITKSFSHRDISSLKVEMFVLINW
jgi:hypothetical protein